MTQLILADIATYTGIGMGILIFLDLMLGDGQKTWLKNVSVRSWYLLSLIAPQRLLSLLSRETPARIAFLGLMFFICGLLVVASVYAAYELSTGDYLNPMFQLVVPVFLICTGLIGVLSFYFRNAGSRLISWYGSNGSVLWFLVKTLVSFGFMYGIVFVFFHAGNNIMLAYAELELYDTFPMLHEVLAFIGMALFVIIFVPIYVAMALFMFVWFFMILFLQVYILYWFIELFVRRIAEHKKGPLIAISVVLSASGLIAKNMSALW